MSNTALLSLDAIWARNNKQPRAALLRDLSANAHAALQQGSTALPAPDATAAPLPALASIVQPLSAGTRAASVRVNVADLDANGPLASALRAYGHSTGHGGVRVGITFVECAPPPEQPAAATPLFAPLKQRQTHTLVHNTQPPPAIVAMDGDFVAARSVPDPNNSFHFSPPQDSMSSSARPKQKPSPQRTVIPATAAPQVDDEYVPSDDDDDNNVEEEEDDGGEQDSSTSDPNPTAAATTADDASDLSEPESGDDDDDDDAAAELLMRPMLVRPERQRTNTYAAAQHSSALTNKGKKKASTAAAGKSQSKKRAPPAPRKRTAGAAAAAPKSKQARTTQKALPVPVGVTTSEQDLALVRMYVRNVLELQYASVAGDTTLRRLYESGKLAPELRACYPHMASNLLTQGFLGLAPHCARTLVLATEHAKQQALQAARAKAAKQRYQPSTLKAQLDRIHAQYSVPEAVLALLQEPCGDNDAAATAASGPQFFLVSSVLDSGAAAAAPTAQSRVGPIDPLLPWIRARKARRLMRWVTRTNSGLTEHDSLVADMFAALSLWAYTRRTIVLLALNIVSATAPNGGEIHNAAELEQLIARTQDAISKRISQALAAVNNLTRLMPTGFTQPRLPAGSGQPLF